MPIPLSGQQRQLLTALAAIRDGKSDAEVEKSIKRTYSYLTDGEVSQVVRDARTTFGKVASIKDADDAAALSDYVGGAGNAPYYVASVTAKWTDKIGRLQFRTVRVAIPKDATKGQIDALVKAEIKRMLITKRNQLEELTDEESDV